MLSKLKNNNREGFTIIEVLIVLAIAGLILLIVFLAVPALQRNARNTDRKSDASAVGAAVSEYEDNNSGALPGLITSAGNGTYYICAAGDTNPCTSATNTDSSAQFKMGYYTKVANAAGGFDVEAAGTNPAGDELYLETGATCAGNKATAAGASADSSVVVFGIESGSGYSTQCIQS